MIKPATQKVMKWTTYNDAIWSTSKKDPTVYKVSAPTKMHEKKSSGTYLELIDCFGKRQVIHCRTRRQLRDGMKMLSMLKRERLAVETVCAQYNVKMGKFQNKKALAQDLRGLGFTEQGVRRLPAMK